MSHQTEQLKLECVRLARDLVSENTVIEDAREIYKFVTEKENNDA